MPNYKVKIEFPKAVEDGNGVKLHAIDVYLQASSILIAGNKAVAYVSDGIYVEESQVTRIFEIESSRKTEVLENTVHACGYYMNAIPPASYMCRKDHIKFKEKYDG